MYYFYLLFLYGINKWCCCSILSLFAKYQSCFMKTKQTSLLLLFNCTHVVLVTLRSCLMFFSLNPFSYHFNARLANKSNLSFTLLSDTIFNLKKERCDITVVYIMKSILVSFHFSNFKRKTKFSF